MNYLDPVFTEKTECQDCFKCVRNCPVKAIKVENESAIVMSELCIACGRCVEICPVGAKRVRDDLGRAKQLLNSGRQTIVSLAPSFISEFPGCSPAQMCAALQSLGVFGVSETALGAQEVSANVAEMLRQNPEPRIYVSSACPTAVDLIGKYFPQHADKITPLMSPVLAHCKLLRRQYGQDLAVIFVGPCIAKKREADAQPGLLDVALTFQELRRWFEERNIVPEEMTTGADFIPGPAEEGALYPMDGGMIAGVKGNCSVLDVQFMAFSGVENIKECLADLDEIELRRPLFLELLACEGGCINGPCGSQRGATVRKRHRVLDHAVYSEEKIPRPPTERIELNLVPEARPAHAHDESEILEALRRVGKYHREDELNCGGCGYDGCRDFAQALLENKAEPSMCVSYMRKLAQNKASALLKTIPSGVVMVNEDLHVVECNEPFARMLGEDVLSIYRAKPGMEGASLAKLIPFSDLFKGVLRSGGDILDRDLRVDQNIFRISIFTIEAHRLVGSILQDITQPAVHKDQVIRKARQVVQKNLATVQKIASLLGENAAESEIILDSIVESFSPTSADEPGLDPFDSEP
jgi:iron only hydrogenase large subunit-like protein